MTEIKRTIHAPSAEAVYHALIFGDISIARLIPPYRLETKEEIKFFFLPTNEMKFKFQIQDEEYNRNTGIIEKSYKKDLCFFVSDYPVTWIILSDYRGENISNNFVTKINTTILEGNKRLSREILAYRSLLSQMSYENELRTKHPSEFRKKLMKEAKDWKDVVGTTQEIISPEEGGGYEQR